MLGMAKDACSTATRIPPGDIERRNGAPWQDVIIEKDLNVVDVTAYVVSRDSDQWDRDNVRDVPAAGEG